MLSENYTKDPEVNKLMHAAVNDSSYVVMETAITHILETNTGEGLSIVKNLEKEENESIREMVAGFYRLYGEDEQYDYMLTVMNHAGGYNKYTAVQNFGKFLLRCAPATATRGIDEIAAIGSDHPQWIVRLSAVQTLSEISRSFGNITMRQPGSNESGPGANTLNERSEMENSAVRKKAEAVMTEIKSKEKDLNLVKIYQAEK